MRELKMPFATLSPISISRRSLATLTKRLFPSVAPPRRKAGEIAPKRARHVETGRSGLHGGVHRTVTESMDRGNGGALSAAVRALPGVDALLRLHAFPGRVWRLVGSGALRGHRSAPSNRL